MKKLLVLTVLMLIIGQVNAVLFCSGSGEHCGGTGSSFDNCCTSIPFGTQMFYCWGDKSSPHQNLDMTCHPVEPFGHAGYKGDYCQNNQDCYGSLVCYNDQQENSYKCGECYPGSSQNFADWEGEGTGENTADRPNDVLCRADNTKCACDYVTDLAGNWQQYTTWSHYDLACDVCQGNGECYAPDGLFCLWTQNEERKICVTAEKDCCQDSDCDNGYRCQAGICILGPTTTTTVVTTSTTTTLEIPQCTNDANCTKDQFCGAGHSYVWWCVNKHQDYMGEPNYYCNRNHNCLSGICSSHADNEVAGDYPPYSNSGPPYDFYGQCLPPTLNISIVTQPSDIAQIGGNFSVRAKVTNSLGQPQSVQQCNIYFETIAAYVYVNGTGNLTSWAYDNYGNLYSSPHPLIYDSTSQYWNYYNNLPYMINKTLTPLRYVFYLECLPNNQKAQTEIGSLYVTFGNFTRIKIISSPDPTRVQGEYNTFRLLYQDINQRMITDATCTLQENDDLFTMTETQGVYNLGVNFNETGNTFIEINCTKTDYMLSSINSQFLVQPNTCNNHMRDSNEDGIDCGGPCQPCSLPPGCFDIKESCTTDTQCCSGFCDTTKTTCQTPTCSDNTKNGDETGLDCGGPICSECTICLTDNNCALDGSYFCNMTTAACQANTCATDADCHQIQWFLPDQHTYVPRTTYCDTDGLCKFTITGNQTTYNLLAQTIPLSGLAANVSGTILYVFNCEDKNNGVKVSTNKPTQTYYSYATSAFSPALPATLTLRQYNNQSTTDNTVMFNELCSADENGYGGIPLNQNLVYARINVKSCDTTICTNSTLLDTITYRKNFKNSINVGLNHTEGASRYYYANASDRNIMVYVKNLPVDNWVNVSSAFAANVLWNQTLYVKPGDVQGVFYYRINSTYGEVAETRVGSPIYFPLEASEKFPYVKLNFTIQGWMIWIVLAVIIAGLAYINYRANNRRGE